MNLNTKTLVTFVLLIQTLHFIFMHVWEWACKCYILGAILTEHTKYETLRNTRSLSFPPWWCHLVADRTRCKTMQNQNLKLKLLKPINCKLSLDSCSVSCPFFKVGNSPFGSRHLLNWLHSKVLALTEVISRYSHRVPCSYTQLLLGSPSQAGTG